MSCYDNIIGLSRADCACLPATPPSGYNTAKSGLFITDVAPLDSLSGFEDCGPGSAWDILSLARSEAVSAFIADTNALLMRTFSSKRERFIGQIGEASGRDFLNTNDTYAGASMAFNPMRGGRAKITAIGTLFSAADTIELTITDSLNKEVGTVEVDTLNGWKLNTLATPIILPTFIDFDSRHEYTVSYEVDPDNLARLNAVGACGSCSFLPWYDIHNPMWKNAYSNTRAWANWMMLGGWTGNSLTEFDLASTSKSTVLNGLAFQIELGCDITQVLCNGELDYTSDPFALSIAYAIRHKACELLATKLIGATELTRFNVINREHLTAMKREWSIRYSEHINYLTNEAQLRQNDCLVCRDDSGMAVQTIFS